MTAAEILRAARLKLSDRSRWTTAFLARNANGERVSCRSPEAVCFCAYGALKAETPGPTDECWVAESFLESAATEVDPMTNGPADINDNLGYEAVIKMYDIAIAKAEGR